MSEPNEALEALRELVEALDAIGSVTDIDRLDPVGMGRLRARWDSARQKAKAVLEAYYE